MKNVAKLREELVIVFEQLKNDELNIKQAKAIVVKYKILIDAKREQLKLYKLIKQKQQL